MSTTFKKIKFYEPTSYVDAEIFEFEVEGTFQQYQNDLNEPEIEVELVHSNTPEFDEIILWSKRKKFEAVEFIDESDQPFKFEIHSILPGTGHTSLLIVQTEQH